MQVVRALNVDVELPRESALTALRRISKFVSSRVGREILTYSVDAKSRRSARGTDRA
jgi:hypothetical protein